MDKTFALSLALLLAAGAAGAEAAEPARPEPMPGTIMRIDQQHHAGDWLRVTMDSARIETRARSFDARGLVGLSPRDRSLQPLDPLPWTQVERIDVLRRRRVRGAVLGAITGAVVTVAAAKSGDFAIGGALGGGLLGGALGGRLIREEELYRAAARAAEPSPARTAETTPPHAAGTNSPPAAELTPPPAAEPSPPRAAEPSPPRAAEPDPAAVNRVALLIRPRTCCGSGATSASVSPTSPPSAHAASRVSAPSTRTSGAARSRT